MNEVIAIYHLIFVSPLNSKLGFCSLYPTPFPSLKCGEVYSVFKAAATATSLFDLEAVSLILELETNKQTNGTLRPHPTILRFRPGGGEVEGERKREAVYVYVLYI